MYMPKWFNKYSDSDSDSDSESSTDSSNDSSTSTVKTPLINKWLKKTGDDTSSDDTTQNNLLSKEHKRQILVNELVQNIKDSLVVNQWIDIYSGLLTIQDSINKNKYINPEFIEIINLIQSTVIDDLDNYKETINKEDLNSFKESLKLINHINEEYGYTINIYNKSKLLVESNEIELTEEELLCQELDKLVSINRPLSDIEILVNRSQEYMTLHLQFLSIYVDRILHSRKLSLSDCEFTYNKFVTILDIIKNNPQLIIREFNEDCVTATHLYISLATTLSLLHKHYKYQLQNTEIESDIYLTLQTWEDNIIQLCDRVYNMYNDSNCKDKFEKIALILNCKLDLCYNHKPYNPDLMKYQKIIQKHSKDINLPSFAILYVSLHLIINNQYSKSLEYIKKVYHTVEDECYIYTPEISILYNQFLARVGLVAFEQKRIEDSFWALSELCQDKNIHVLLGQVPHNRQYNLLIPFHKHVDVSIMMERFLICCLLIDLSSSPIPFSKLYSAILFKYNNDGLLGDPTSLDKIIYKAVTQIKQGNWEIGYKLLQSLDSFKYIQNDILKLIKKRSLESHIKTYSKYYKNYCIPTLVRDYQLPYSEVNQTLHELDS